MPYVERQVLSCTISGLSYTAEKGKNIEDVERGEHEGSRHISLSTKNNTKVRCYFYQKRDLPTTVMWSRYACTICQLVFHVNFLAA